MLIISEIDDAFPKMIDLLIKLINFGFIKTNLSFVEQE